MNPSIQKNNAKKSGKARGPPQKKRADKGPRKQKEVAIAAAYSRPQKTMALSLKVNPDGSKSLRWKEFVQDIAGSVSFAVTQFPVNPGLPSLFAWLSSQAIFFQEYEFRMLSFDYETEKGSSTNGKVMFAFQQDSTDSAPVSKQEMLENMYKCSGAPWEPFTLSVPRRALDCLGQQRYIRSGTLAANLDQKTYDVGQLLVATQGMADTTAVGELYVNYEVVLKTPLMNARQQALVFSKTVTAVSPSQTSLFGTTPTYTGSLDVTGTVNTLTFNRVGNYLVEVGLLGTGLFTTFAPVTSASTATVTTTGFGISNAAANAGTIAMFSFTVVVTLRGQTAVFACSTQSTTISAAVALVGAYALN